MGPRGFTVRTFVDPTDSSRVGLVVEGATLGDFQELLKSDAAAEAMKHDGVRADTVGCSRNAETRKVLTHRHRRT